MAALGSKAPQPNHIDSDSEWEDDWESGDDEPNVVGATRRITDSESLVTAFQDVNLDGTAATIAEGMRISPEDVVIAVMGVTGSGKSTFISHFCPEAAVGHGLESCTIAVAQFHCTLQDGSTAWFIDTPGFDDTNKTDTDVLREISDWLNSTYAHQIRLSGIIYLHRISDTRIGGSGMRNLRMFKKLVGDDSLGNIALASTMWSMLPDMAVGEAREVELRTRDEFWGYMIRNGSRVFRQDRGRESALEIVQHIVTNLSNRRATLDIQRDMVEGGMRLRDTAAGQEVQATLAEKQAQFKKQLAQIKQETTEAIEARDKEHQEELGKYQREIGEQIRRGEEAVERLNVTKDEIRREAKKEWEAEKKRILKEHSEHQAAAAAAAAAAAETARRAREEEQREYRRRQQEADRLEEESRRRIERLEREADDRRRAQEQQANEAARARRAEAEAKRVRDAEAEAQRVRDAERARQAAAAREKQRREESSSSDSSEDESPRERRRRRNRERQFMGQVMFAQAAQAAYYSQPPPPMPYYYGWPSHY